MRNLISERKLSKIRNWQKEEVIKYFLLNDNYDKYKILISEETNNENTELEINKLFENKQVALDLITLLCENSVPIEQSNEVVQNFIK